MTHAEVPVRFYKLMAATVTVTLSEVNAASGIADDRSGEEERSCVVVGAAALSLPLVVVEAAAV
jgi:hypothetical protein